MTGTAYYINRATLEEILGPTNALVLMTEFGGSKFYIPEKPNPESRLAICLGLDVAQKLAEYAATGKGGLLCEVPMGRASKFREHNLRMKRLLRTNGVTDAMISRELGVTPRSVRRARSKMLAAEASQPKIARAGLLSGASVL